ncbi:phospho-sugar mutase [Malacoplasma penetrans]|uniref:Phosphomannomutase n=1 Tax=Malacoplasma penetrans (strain HF-2) TaxID=272633 RepID=Q8EWU4_MALP2|nr:phospho-sugar mutase [Malacoplasma penetrans]RXY97318.1 phospho-sugar mutase [Malacoplasma penetrans]BAC43899.1 phosphomannomutase [Malacoplasma penetrans HF-2]
MKIFQEKNPSSMHANVNPLSKAWLESNRISNKYKELILKMNEEEIDKYFSYSKLSFGTAGIRATMGPGTNQINVFTYQQMSEGVARWLLNKKSNPTVIVAHDNRMNADYYAMVIAKTLTSFGIKVFLYKENQIKATPIISYSVRETGVDAAIIATASHNPKNYLGFKVYNHTGGQILDSEANEIVSSMPECQTIIDNVYTPNMDLISYFDDTITESYFEASYRCLINTNIYRQKNFPVILTTHHGTASYDLPYLLKSIGYENIILAAQQCVPDPNFTYSANFNPEDKASFDLSLKYAEKYRANIMLGVDPDSDRLAVVVRHKNKWHYLTGNQMGIIFTHYVLTNKKFDKTPFVVSTFVSTNYIDRIAEKYNAKVFRTPTGFKWVGNEMNKHIDKMDFVVGFEEAIGSLNSDIGRDKDGFQAAALALEVYTMLYDQEKTLVDYLDEIFEEFGAWTGETVSYKIESLNWKEEMQEKMDKFANVKNKDILGLEIKGIRWNEPAQALEWYLENDMWVKFRLSGTEPKFKIYYEIYGETKEICDQILKALKDEFEYMLRS